MFSRVIPSWEQIEHFSQPLTEGERYLLAFLDKYLKRDDTFQGSDLTKYNGWLIFVQPFLNGSRPDIVIFNPYVGVQVFEVKDWTLDYYSFEMRTDGDKSYEIFCYTDHYGTHEKKSPIKQVQHYKEKLISQLMPQIGESIDENNKRFGLIKTAVYFHKSTGTEVRTLFNNRVKDYSSFPLIGRDALKESLLDKVVPDVNKSSSAYWQREWNRDLLFWLYPPFHSIEQGTKLTLIDNQKKFAEPQSGHYRVRGVAGSGKTQVLAYRAGQLASRGGRVLILTFNITLVHLVHDMVQRSPYAFDWNDMTITYFHGFCKDVLNRFEVPWPVSDDEDEEALFKEVVPNKVLGAIKGKTYEKYDAIFIDEGQDFCIEWYSMLCHFLSDRDEVVVVCDKKQNIYGRTTEWLDKRHRGVEKFGDWIELRKIIRLPEQVAKISVEFSEIFELNRDIRISNITKPDLFNQFQDHVLWWNVGSNWFDSDWLGKVEEAFETIKKHATHKHPSDTVILLPSRKHGFKCIDYFVRKKKLMVNHVFDQRHKKTFWMGDGRLKMSTIHSFKGWEVPNVIVVIPSLISGKEELFDMLIYTAITRSRENLIIINENARYWKFGESVPQVWTD